MSFRYGSGKSKGKPISRNPGNLKSGTRLIGVTVSAIYM